MLFSQIHTSTYCMSCWKRWTFKKTTKLPEEVLSDESLYYYDNIYNILWNSFWDVIQSFWDEWVIFTTRKNDWYKYTSPRLWRIDKYIWWNRIDRMLWYPLSSFFKYNNPLEREVAYVLISNFLNLQNCKKYIWAKVYTSNKKKDNSIYKKIYNFLLMYDWLLKDPMRFMEENDNRMQILEDYEISDEEIHILKNNYEILKQDIKNIYNYVTIENISSNVNNSLFNRRLKNKHFKF